MAKRKTTKRQAAPKGAGGFNKMIKGMARDASLMIRPKFQPLLPAKRSARSR